MVSRPVQATLWVWATPALKLPATGSRVAAATGRSFPVLPEKRGGHHLPRYGIFHHAGEWEGCCHRQWRSFSLASALVCRRRKLVFSGKVDSEAGRRDRAQQAPGGVPGAQREGEPRTGQVTASRLPGSLWFQLVPEIRVCPGEAKDSPEGRVTTAWRQPERRKGSGLRDPRGMCTQRSFPTLFPYNDIVK